MEFGEYISLLLGVCVVSGVTGALCPEGRMKKYVEIICSLCVICAIAVPIINAASSAPSLDDFFGIYSDENEILYDEIYNSYVADGQISDAENKLAELIAERCGAPERSVSVRLDCSMPDEKIIPVAATVTVYPEALHISPDKIKENVTNFARIKCTIIYASKGENGWDRAGAESQNT